jgi:hypothetical protein
MHRSDAESLDAKRFPFARGVLGSITRTHRFRNGTIDPI